jgi:hypothetical protein
MIEDLDQFVGKSFPSFFIVFRHVHSLAVQVVSARDGKNARSGRSVKGA